MLDDRTGFVSKDNSGWEIIKIKPTIISRLLSEKWLVKNAKPNDLVFCFGNLPPLFKVNSRIILFVQNRYLIQRLSLKGFSLKVKIRLSLERFWFKYRLRFVDSIIVQTPTMKHLLKKNFEHEIPIKIMPIISGTNDNDVERPMISDDETQRSKMKFIYVASGEPHKNHIRLIEAWKLLAEEEIYPSLSLTLDLGSELGEYVTNLARKHELCITNLGFLDQNQIPRLLKNYDALIFPSTLESFGLPLIEARQAGIKIIASEKDFVRDIIDPEETFDPYSPISIARSVKRLLRIETKTINLFKAQAVIDELVR